MSVAPFHLIYSISESLLLFMLKFPGLGASGPCSSGMLMSSIERGLGFVRACARSRKTSFSDDLGQCHSKCPSITPFHDNTGLVVKYNLCCYLFPTSIDNNNPAPTTFFCVSLSGKIST